MSAKLLDNRVQFYLNHRDTIREWAAIEEDVRRAVRGLLDALQAPLERDVRDRDNTAVAVRWDGGGYQRIFMRRPEWPSGLGITLEWAKSRVDPFGSNLPKIGVFFIANGDTDKAIRSRLVEDLKAEGGFAAMGYLLAAEAVWPTRKYVPKSSDWWKDPDAWAGQIAVEIFALWDKAAPVIIRALAREAHEKQM